MMGDEEIIQRCLDGDKEAFELIVARYQKPVFAFVFSTIGTKEEALDLTQETMIRTYVNLRKFQQGKKFSSWLFQIAKNLSRDYIKKKKPVLFDAAEVEIESGNDSLPENRLIRDETSNEVRSAIGRLPAHLRIPLILQHINGLSYKEMSEVLELPLPTVKNRLYQARTKMKQLLQEGSEICEMPAENPGHGVPGR